jgi:hypothetical protein
MIVDEAIFVYWNKRYSCDNPIIRKAIVVNEDFDEASNGPALKLF